MFDQLLMLDLVNIDANLLLYGNNNLPLHINKNMFASVQKLIDESLRFK